MAKFDIIRKENHRRNVVENYIIAEDAEIIFRNFAGAAGKYNDEGDRSFSIVIDDKDFAMMLREQGWNVRQLRARDEYEEPSYSLQIAVSYRRIGGIKPMEIMLLKPEVAILVDEDMVAMLDYATITYSKLVIRPREWEPGKIKAYLSEMDVQIEDSILDHRYQD